MPFPLYIGNNRDYKKRLKEMLEDRILFPSSLNDAIEACNSADKAHTPVLFYERISLSHDIPQIKE